MFNGVALRLFNANAGNTNQWVFGTGGAYVAKDAFSIGDSSAIRMSILSNGNVGIGTTDPLRKLHMIDSTSNLLFGSEDGSAVMRLLNAAPNSITALILGNKTREWHLRVDGVGAADGKYSIYDNTANAYRLTVDGSGNVGIGTINPTTKLDISGSDSLFNGVALSLFNANAGNTNRWVLGTGGNTVAKDAFSIGDINGYKMTILSNGNVSVGTTTPLDKLHVSGDIRVGVNSLGCIKRSDGSPIAGTCSSDLRFKQQITPFSNLLDKVARLQPVHFYWRAEEFPTRHFGTEQSFGLIAQDVEAVLPELVATDEEGYRAVNYSKLPLLTLQAVKELKGEQDSLKAQNLVLQEQNAVLQARLDKLEQMMRQLLEAAEKPSPKQP
ncbi:MAG TPA: tail fiber domain-containing protein [Blastocatellia bacterium]|nr:tail fiber domain-containing protein [Blastocatellia bacterium]